MKSYFAKLAARANVPVSLPLTAPKTSDPFAENVVSANPSVPHEGSKNSPSSSDSTLRPTPPPTHLQTEIVSPKSRRFETESTEPSEHEAVGLKPERKQPELQVDLDSAMKLEPPSAVVEARLILEKDVEPTQPITTPKLIPPEVPPPDTRKRMLDHSLDSPVAETSLANVDFAEIQRDQMVLLRKADVFMERLFERHEESDQRESDLSQERQELSKSQNQATEPSRLQPMPPAARAPEQADQRPGLVIGNLTVEVIPPTPAPVAPPQQVVVVREIRSSRTAFPSSRRFGLSQF